MTFTELLMNYKRAHIERSPERIKFDAIKLLNKRKKETNNKRNKYQILCRMLDLYKIGKCENNE